MGVGIGGYRLGGGLADLEKVLGGWRLGRLSGATRLERFERLTGSFGVDSGIRGLLGLWGGRGYGRFGGPVGVGGN